MKPKASTKTRDKYIRNPTDKATKLHVSKETVRTAQCPRPDHFGIKSSNFEGVSDAGWLFRCPGNSGEEWHHFVAEPAE